MILCDEDLHTENYAVGCRRQDEHQNLPGAPTHLHGLGPTVACGPLELLAVGNIKIDAIGACASKQEHLPTGAQ